MDLVAHSHLLCTLNQHTNFLFSTLNVLNPFSPTYLFTFPYILTILQHHTQLSALSLLRLFDARVPLVPTRYI
ncbi:hypothetical protein K449DRAFT_381607 [Hypoxylon sp. EC38]|nr:hypothetical protein K449DRAFT_381607 [Hypoxylon sp. EC38]